MRGGAGGWSGVTLLLFEHFDCCRSETESFEDVCDIDQVSKEGTLLDGGWHYDGVSGQDGNVVKAAIGEEDALAEAFVLVTYD